MLVPPATTQFIPRSTTPRSVPNPLLEPVRVQHLHTEIIPQPMVQPPTPRSRGAEQPTIQPPSPLSRRSSVGTNFVQFLPEDRLTRRSSNPEFNLNSILSMPTLCLDGLHTPANHPSLQTLTRLHLTTGTADGGVCKGTGPRVMEGPSRRTTMAGATLILRSW
jgi:hypothetical protein